MTAPGSIRLTVWFDRELDVDTGDMPPWLAQAALSRAYELLEPEMLFPEDGDEEEEDD